MSGGNLPVVFRGEMLRALVVGGGTVALRKVEDLLVAKAAKITVIAPEIHPDLEVLIERNELSAIRREYLEGEIWPELHKSSEPPLYNLIVAATDDPEINLRVSHEARAAMLPVNVVDTPELCTFYFSAVLRHDPLLVSISTGGAAPFLAKAIRDDLQDRVEHHWSMRAHWAGPFRDFLRERQVPIAQRDTLFAHFLEQPDEIFHRWNSGTTPEPEWSEWIVTVRGAAGREA